VVVPTPRGVGFLVVAAALAAVMVWSGTPQLAPALSGSVAAVVLGWGEARRAARRARASLGVGVGLSAVSVPVGTPVTLEMAVSNRSHRPAPALGVELPPATWPRGQAGPGPRPRRWRAPRRLALVPGPPPGGTSVVTSPVPSGERGVLVLPRRRMWVSDTLGLWAAAGPVVPGATLVVYPPPATPWGRRGAGGRPGAIDGGVTDYGGRQGAGELVGVRAYAPGDRLSLLDWRSTGRAGQWQVRHFGPEWAERWRFVVDDRPSVHRRADFERLVAAVHGVLEQCWQRGGTAELSTASGRRLELAPTTASLERARAFLAGLLPQDSAEGVPLDAGTVLTTATGARSIPEGVDRLVVP
jgi:uncharacterized protein (DUF58 family)